MKNLAKILIAEQLTTKKKRMGLIKKINCTNTKNIDSSLKSLLPKGKENYEFENVVKLKNYLIKRLDLNTKTRIKHELSKLNFTNNLEPINQIYITVEWKKSTMWGLNPKAETYINGLGLLTSGSINGCGFDKQSTAVAIILNQIPQILRLMYELKNKNYKTRNHDLFGYGSGYNILPKFEEAVGVVCYEKILDRIGYKFCLISTGNSFSVFSLTKK